MDGKIEAIWVKRAQRGVMDPASSVTLVRDHGVEGDASFGRSRRQVTLIEKEVFDRIRDRLPDATPDMRRANFMLSGVRLEGTRGFVLTLGGARILIQGETRPCERMDEQCLGLTDALDPEWSGGVHGVVVEGGSVSVGDAARIPGLSMSEGGV